MMAAALIVWLLLSDALGGVELTSLPPRAPGGYPPEVYSQVSGDALAGLWPWPSGQLHAEPAASGGFLCLDTRFHLRDTSLKVSERVLFAIRTYQLLLAALPHRSTTVKGDSPWCSSESLLMGLDVHIERLDNDDSAPSIDMDESYELVVAPPRGKLHVRSSVGVLRGLETFSQLLAPGGARHHVDLGVAPVLLRAINATSVRIVDAPRFPHRAIMLDSSRHFLPIESIMRVLDAMLWNKLNVLHWHLSDAQAFPLRTPFTIAHNLDRGAYSPSQTYTRGDLDGIVVAASLRGIRVIPEVDTPSHVQSWAVRLLPDMFIDCGYNTLLNPVSESVDELMDGLVGELASIFPDQLLHIGMDEVVNSCLNKSASVHAWLAAHGRRPDDVGMKAAVARYLGVLSDTVRRHGRTPVAWQEAFDHYGDSEKNPTPPPQQLLKDTIIEIWYAPQWEWATTMDVVRAGFRGLQSNGWYLDGGEIFDWPSAYAVEPLTNLTCTYAYIRASHDIVSNCTCATRTCFEIRNADEVARVLGGEAPIWGEHVDAAVLPFRAWPRASAVAERLWSIREVNDLAAAWSRLARQRCRMISRGISVTTLGPGDECIAVPTTSEVHADGLDVEPVVI